MSEEQVKIRTREEHKRFIRRIWVICIVMAVLVFGTTGGIVGALFLAGYDSKKVVEISTSIFQVVCLSYGLGFFVPAFLTSLITMHLGVEMSRKALDIGEQTANHVDRLQGELKNMVNEFKTSLTDAKAALTKAEQAMVEIRDHIKEQKREANKLEDSLAQEVLGTVIKGDKNGSLGSSREPASLEGGLEEGL
jgi:hypothetical protein